MSQLKNTLRATLAVRALIVGSAALLVASAASAQLTVSPQTDLSALAAAITGPGVRIANPVINCHTQGYGEFNYSGSILGINEGVLLTSGRITETIGPNNVENKTFEQGTSGNSLLNVVTGRTTRDACMFEFDIIPSGDSLRFNFVLGSEEYNEWVGSQYNDVFGFFISGPGITGDAGIGSDHNIALVPGTNSPVTINNVNNGSHSQYYYDNAGGQDLQYDGLTQGLYAESIVQPCQTYHLKLVVADASDRKFDSGVFIERIQSNQVVMTSGTVNGTPHMVEGCNPGWVTFTRPAPLPTPLNLTYYLQGTAINGTDYTAIGNVNPNVPKTITIPANQTSVSVNVTPQADAVSEPTENLLFILGNPLCPAVALDSLLFDIHDTLIATVSPTTALICRGDSVQFHISGGADYAWSPAGSLSSATSAHPWAKPTANTTYTLTVNEGTCSRTFTRLVRVSNPQLSVVTTRPLCEGASNGAINLTVTGGQQPYTYAWTGPSGFSASTEDLVNIVAGTYSVNIVDNIGCTRTQSFNVGSPGVLNGALTPSILPFGENIACHSASTGTLTLAITGGTGPYSTSWAGPNGFTANSQNLTGLAAGAYTVNITDANGCTHSTSYTMTQPAAISPSISGVANVLCFGNNIGQATVNTAGGVPPLSYSWNSVPVQTTATATGLAPRNYTVTVTDGYNCTSAVSTTIAGPAAALATSITTQTNVNCFGGNTGSATVAATGGTSPYNYSWNTTPVQTSATANNLAAGTWICTVTDANGCSTTRNVTITQPAAALSSSIGTQTNVNCFGGNTGSATVSAAGGTTPYAYSWNTTPVQTSASATNLPAGTWTCTITDARGCTTAQNVTITQPAAALAATLGAQTNVNCFGGNTGNATIAVSGGTTPYAYSWNTVPVQTAATANNLPAGTWTCTITDARGCSTTSAVTITQPAAALTTSITTQTNVNCFGGNTGSATVAATGGTSPFNYSWNTTPVQTSATASNLAAGTWICTVTDANGCSTTRNVTITQPAAALSLNGTVTPATCGGAFNGAVDATVSGGNAPYITTWSGPNGFTSTSTDISSLGSGVYTLYVSDGNGCTTNSSFNVGQPGLFSISATTSSFNGFEVSCPTSTDGSIAQTTSGGTAPYTQSWSGPNGFTASTEDIAGLASGTYTYILTDDNGCSTSASYTLNAPPALSASLSAPTTNGGWNIACNGGTTGSIAAIISGGVAPVTTQWTGPNAFTANTEDITSLVAGTYTLTLTDDNGCSASSSTTLTQAPLLNSVGSMTSSVRCSAGNDGAAQVIASGGTAPYSFSWNTTPVQNTSTVHDLVAGDWTCTVTDANGCQRASNVTISQPASPLSASIDSQSDVLCHGAAEGTATASANGGTAPYSFVWSTAPAQTGTTATGLIAGTYSINVMDARGCTASNSVTIAQPADPITAFVDQITHETCFGAADGEATIVVSGGTGSYTVIWDTEPPNSGFTATGLAPGLYMVAITDNNGCTETKQHPVTIQGSSAPLTYTLGVQQITCNAAEDGSINLTLQGGAAPYSHIWSDGIGQQTGLEDLSGLGPDTYTLQIIDFFGCTLDTAVIITEPTLLTTSGTITTAACQGSSSGAVDATVSGGTTPYTYAWSGPNGYTASTLDITALAAGTYDLTVTDANGCNITTAFNVSQPGSLQVQATLSNFNGGWGVSCATAGDGSIDLDVTGGTSPFTYQWTGPNTFTANSQDISGLIAGTYSVNVSDANGCSVALNNTIAAPATLAASATASVYGSTNVSCNGAADGTLITAITGGTAPYAILWTGPNAFNSMTENPTGLEVGTYTLNVEDANGCTTSTTMELTEPQPLSTTNVVPTSASGDAIACNGGSNGQIQLVISGGSAPASVLWSGPNGYTANTASISDLIAGTYDALVTDANGCTTTTTATLTEPASLSVSGITGDFNGSGTSCSNATDGSIDLTVSGGAGNNTFIWSSTNGFGATTEDVSGLEPGSYSVQVIDINGCISTADFEINAPEQVTNTLSISDNNGSNVSCAGASDATIDLTIAGGTAPFTIAWNGPDGFSSNSEDLSGLSEGTYSVTITDANGCTSNATTDLSVPSPLDLDLLTSNFASGDNISCAGATDGSVDLTITGGTVPYTVAWTDGVGFTATTEDINGLNAGFYQAVVTDANGCSANVNTLLTAPTPLDLSAVLSNINGNNVTCDGATDGAIDISVSGGVEPYSILWNDGSNNEDRNGITAGTYSVTITDANACTVSASYTLTAPATVMVDVTSLIQPGGMNITCAGGSDGNLDAAISGGTLPYAITWSGPNNFTANTASISALVAGNYDLVITDANGCGNSTSHVVSEPSPLNVNLSSVTYNGGFNIPCATIGIGVFDATATGGTPGYSFAWNGPDGFTSTDEDLTSLVAGQYDLTVTDANGCSSTASASLTAPGPLDVVIQISDYDGAAVSCAGNDGGVEISISGGTPAYQLDWTGPNGFASQQEDLTGLIAGAYTLIVRDANGCEEDTTFTLSAPEPLLASFATNPNLCGDASLGTIDLTMSGGGAPYSFAWSGPNGFSTTDEDPTGLVNGQYTVTVNDGLSCTSTFTTTLNGPAPINSGTYVCFYGLHNLQCQGDSSGVINLAPVGGASPFTIAMAGPGGFTSTASQNTGLVAGDYSITITDHNGCLMDTLVTLTQPSTSVTADLTLSVYPSGTNVSCYGATDGSIDATVNGGNGPYVFSWRGPDDQELSATEDVSGLAAGEYNYELVVIDANQCNFFTTVMLTQPDTALYTSAVASVFNGFNTSCSGTSDGAIDLTIAGGNGGYSQSWNGPNGFASNAEDISDLAGGTYTATVTDINGCTVDQVVEIIAPEPIAPALNASTFPGGTAISCANANDGSINAVITGGVAPFTLVWSGPDGFTSSAANITDLAAGTYCLTVTDDNGCSTQSCSTLEAPSTLTAAANTSSAACSGANGSVDLTVSGGSSPFQYQWDNGAVTEDLSGLAAGVFSVLVTDANGCTTNTTATVNGSNALDVTATSADNSCYGSETGGVDLTVSSGTQPYAFVWSNGADTEDLQNIGAGIYGVTVTDAAGCSFTSSYVIQQPTAIDIDTIISTYAEGYNVSSYGANDGSITTAVSGGNAPYTFIWSNGATTESISGVPAGEYTLTVTDASGCSATLTVELTQATDLTMPTAFSPNGDGDNQYFVVRGLEGYPKNLLTVMNRWGNVVYEQPNYKNEWAGESNQGNQLPNGTYFIILSMNDGTRTLQGYVDLRR